MKFQVSLLVLVNESLEYQWSIKSYNSLCGTAMGQSTIFSNIRKNFDLTASMFCINPGLSPLIANCACSEKLQTYAHTDTEMNFSAVSVFAVTRP
jgi:hypothetical protein